MLSRQLRFVRVEDPARHEAICRQYNIDDSNIDALLTAVGGREVAAFLQDDPDTLHWLISHGKVSILAGAHGYTMGGTLPMANEALARMYGPEHAFGPNRDSHEMVDDYEQKQKIAAIHNETANLGKLLTQLDMPRVVFDRRLDVPGGTPVMIEDDQARAAPPAVERAVRDLVRRLDQAGGEPMQKLIFLADSLVVAHGADNEIAFIYGVDPAQPMPAPEMDLAPFPTF